jgi:cobalamin biosynthesis protein CobD/CbiB
MRSVELARAAAQAEALYLRRVAQRQVSRAVFGAIAAVFGIAILVMVHVLAYDLLLGYVSPPITAVILLAFDLVVAIVFAVLARRNEPDQIEQEAKMLRDQSIAEMRSSLTLMSLAASATGLVVRRRVGRSSRVRVSEGSPGLRLLGTLVSRLVSRR